MQRMAKLLLNLRHVADDEIEDVTAFLDAHGIAWYPTKPSLFGISAGGIWIEDNADWPRARALMDDYQRQRSERVRRAQAEAVRDGRARTFGDVLRDEPIRVVLTMLAIAFLLALVAVPGWMLR